MMNTSMGTDSGIRFDINNNNNNDDDDDDVDGFCFTKTPAN